MTVLPEDFFKRRVHIDDEGYPTLDGLRVGDEESLRDIFSNLRRAKVGDPRSSVVTTWGGTDVTVEAFSSPIVVQSVSVKGDGFYTANVLGTVSFDFKLLDLQIDEWNRLHLFLGPDQIEATFARKAQAELLLSLDHETFFSAFRSNAASVQKKSFWDDAYEAEKDGWDLGKVSPSLEWLATKWLLGDKIPKRVLIPGAGRAYEAQWLSQKGHEVTAEDFSNRAREEFFKANGDSRVSYEVRDFFGDQASQDDGYDAIAELIFFCAIDPQMRRTYFEQIHRRLKPGGLLVGIFLVTYGPGGPPYSTTPWELRAHAQDLFHVKHWQMSRHSIPARVGKEFEIVLQKRL